MKGLCNLATTALIGTPQLAVHVSCRALRNQGVSDSSQSVTSQWARVSLVVWVVHFMTDALWLVCQSDSLP